MRKKILVLLLTSALLTGCSVSGSATVGSGTVSGGGNINFNQKEISAGAPSSAQESGTLSWADCKKANLCEVDSHSFQFSANRQIDGMNIVVTFPWIVKATNGIPIDLFTVRFTKGCLDASLDKNVMQTLYAADSISFALSHDYYVKTANQKELEAGKPIQTKSFKNGGIYKEDTNFFIKSDSGIIHHVYTTTRDGKTKVYSDITYEWLKPHLLKGRSDGKNKIHIVFADGTDIPITYYLDTVDPKYTLSSSGFLKAWDPEKDNYHSDIASITCNGVEMSNNSYVPMRGKLRIVVMDRAGNRIEKNEYLRKK